MLANYARWQDDIVALLAERGVTTILNNGSVGMRVGSSHVCAEAGVVRWMGMGWRAALGGGLCAGRLPHARVNGLTCVW